MAWARPFLLTIELMIFSSMIAAVLGILLAWLHSLVSRQLVNGRIAWGRIASRYFYVSAIACLATPLVLHAAAWEAAAGKFGWLSLTQTSTRTYTGLAGHFGGMIASAWIHGLFGSALVALSTDFATRRTPTSVLDVARMEMSPRRMWWSVQLPLALPWIVSALLASATIAASEMTVVDLYGVRTVADEFYLFYAMEPSLVSILRTLVLPGVFLIALLAAWASARQKINLASSADASPEEASSPDGGTAWGAMGLVTVSSLWIAFPVLALILKTGHQLVPAVESSGQDVVVWSIVKMVSTLLNAPIEFGREYQWTIGLAVSTALVSIPFGWTIAAAVRSHRRARSLVDVLSVVLFIIPGPLVGLTVVYFFSLPIPGFRDLYQATLLPTILGLLVRSVPASYWVMRAGYHGISSAVFDSAALELSWWKRAFRIDFWILKGHLWIAGLVAGMIGAGDVPIALPILPPGVVTVGTRLFSLLHSGARHQEASLAFWYVSSTILLAVVLSRCWKRAHG